MKSIFEQAMLTEKKQSALKVNEGIQQPPIVSNESLANFKSKRKKNLSVDEYVRGILSQNRTILSQAITLIESSLQKHQEIARQIIEMCLPYTGKSVRIGVTGVPGVGKSSFIEILGMGVVSKGHKLAVLAIDPSSGRSGGSIMGDKTRMEQLSVQPNAFIRPSPSAGSLGGVARKTRETIYLCEAAGFDVIFIETVGVGQSETVVHSMVDFFLLLMLAGAGDELQGIKRGIMEMADLIAITKADGANIEKANLAKIEYQNALHLFPIGQSGWQTDTLTCSAHQNLGIDKIWETIEKYIEFTKGNNHFFSNRVDQSKYWMHQTIEESLLAHFYKSHSIQYKLAHVENEVLAGKVSSFEGARMLLNEYFKKI
jgi:LAO/AO transport system kinase